MRSKTRFYSFSVTTAAVTSQLDLLATKTVTKVVRAELERFQTAKKNRKYLPNINVSDFCEIKFGHL